MCAAQLHNEKNSDSNCGNTHISSLLFSTPFHIITPNTHPYTDPDNSRLTISSIQSSVTHQSNSPSCSNALYLCLSLVSAPYAHAAANALHHNSTLLLPPSISTSANNTALLRAPSKPTHVNKPRPLTLPTDQWQNCQNGRDLYKRRAIKTSDSLVDRFDISVELPAGDSWEQ
jgi:hypothetical protein